MYAFAVKREYRKPLGRLIWRLFVITIVLFSTFPNYEQKLTPNPAPDSPLKDPASGFSQLQSNPTSSTPNDDDTKMSNDTTTTDRKSTPGTTPEVVLPPPGLLSKSGGPPTESVANVSETGTNHSRLTSCEGRCGDKNSLPCSCTDVCLVNGNCCHNIRTYCFSLVESARKRMKHLHNAKVECSSITSTYMIMSCPSSGEVDSAEELALGMDYTTGRLSNNRSSGKSLENPTWTKPPSQGFRHKSSSNLNPDSSFDETQSPFSDASEKSTSSSNAFLALLLDSPVTDQSTGLVYKNQIIARCNGVSDSDILYWKVQVAVTSLSDNPENLAAIDNIVSSKTAVYSRPDSNEYVIDISRCYVSSLRQCQEVWLQDRPYLEDMCLNGGIAYYQTFSPLKRQVYDNIYCLICNLGSANFSVPLIKSTPGQRTFKLSLVASLTSGGALSVKAAAGKQMFTWSSVECSLSEREQEGGACRRADSRVENSVKCFDGSCRFPQTFGLAISAKGCPYSRSEKTERKLLSLSKCYLETYLDAEFDMETIRFRTVYNKRFGLLSVQLLATVYFQFSVPLSRFFVSTGKEAEIFRNFLMLVYDADLCCDQHPQSFLCTNSSCRLGDLEVPVLKTIPRYPSPSGEAISDSSLILCLASVTKIYKDEDPPFPLTCLQEPVYVSQLHFFHRVANVSCFGEHIGKHALHVRHRRQCNSAVDKRFAVSPMRLTLQILLLVCPRQNLSSWLRIGPLYLIIFTLATVSLM
ncbi:hypothetical protein ElyMa_004889700 [Elysia marginata]|uniref:SMB domain-containing protein n=1 Tax=Elysia marginata TaxID=1093978 RepID=A0AAV4IWR9_9GAST|nr:hypothetical protein ElyMa_004889700 [Elysia marginata]